MTLKDLLRKHKKLQDSSAKRQSADRWSAGSDLTKKSLDNPVPEFTFLRTTTNTQEIIAPPHFPGDDDGDAAGKAEEVKTPEKKRMSIFRSRSGTVQTVKSVKSEKSEKSEKSGDRETADPDHNASITISPTKASNALAEATRPDMKRKLSDRLHISSRARAQSRASNESSPNLPSDLEDPPDPALAPLEGPDAKGKFKSAETKEAKAKREELWERRACKLALNIHVPSAGPWGMAGTSDISSTPGRRQGSGTFLDKKQEDNIQEAIRLHEAGNLERSTAIFGRLADPKGANNPLSQVLYGLALRHGWGIDPSAEIAMLYLSLAARTSAQIQLTSSPESPGDSKGELILAIFELGNCFRFGWGCRIDKIAAKVFYEVAANLGDPDALEEAAWCCMEGFGGSKDKFRAAQYYRLAECAGRKRVGENWIWKEKYHDPIVVAA